MQSRVALNRHGEAMRKRLTAGGLWLAVFKNVIFGFAPGARSRESLCGTTTPCKDMTSPLAFILSTGIKEEELVHSLPVDMTTKQALASRNKLEQTERCSLQFSFAIN